MYIPSEAIEITKWRGNDPIFFDMEIIFCTNKDNVYESRKKYLDVENIEIKSSTADKKIDARVRRKSRNQLSVALSGNIRQGKFSTLVKTDNAKQ